ncbi:MAG: type II/IV secretion system protein [Proteobacteria bacterium]|nr:type II/IV secretion system protein [Desulfobacula sp.]MBU3950973.1 type II/IV secretion system protein [Pseudomonadota bacterium]MBU4131237.1 type II/IV secretion system protein [Pseudomonadota bacterium]
MKRKKLGEILVQKNIITPEQLNSALDKVTQTKKRLGEILIQMNLIQDSEICKILANQLKIPYAGLRLRKISPKVLNLIPPAFCYQKRSVPLGFKGKTLMVAMGDPTEYEILKDISFITGLKVKPMIEEENIIIDFLLRHHSPPLEDQAPFHLGTDTTADMIHMVEQINDQDDISFINLERAAQGGVIRELTNGIIANAIKLSASDIHIEPQENDVIVRFRVDGIMQDVMTFTKTAHPSAVSRIKIMASLDITERRTPQDGRARIRVMEKAYDLRISSLPTYYGEKIAIRLLEARLTLPLEKLGMVEKDIEQFKSILKRPQGIVLITGPTGSGKTTTLYSALGYVYSPKINIVTIEDPVEYSLPGINQVPVNKATGMTFAKGLRSLLRQDPDVVMVGEIRDEETASIAFQAAQTGHLVLSTLHTNDAVSTLLRLKNMGIDPFWISSSLICVIGQRLVRRIHQPCIQNDTVSDKIRARFPKTAPGVLKRGKGCGGCQATGYQGRVGIYEMFIPDQELEKVIVANTSTSRIREYAEKSGMVSMCMDGFRKVLEGKTTLEEIMRAAPPPEKTENKEAPGDAPKDKILPPPETRENKVTKKSPLLSHKDIILVIDDDEAILRYVDKILTKEFYSVVTSSNGKEGLDKIFSNPPDLILVDYKMPGINGIDFIEKLRGHSRMAKIPVIMLTAVDAEKTEVQALNMGADDWISKPIQKQRLLARIKRLLKK